MPNYKGSDLIVGLDMGGPYRCSYYRKWKVINIVKNPTDRGFIQVHLDYAGRTHLDMINLK